MGEFTTEQQERTPNRQVHVPRLAGRVGPLRAAGEWLTARYEVLGLMREARLYDVLRALDHEAGDAATLWVVEPDLLVSDDGDAAGRFLAHADRARQVMHAGLRRILDAGSDGGLVFVSVEPLAGQTLADCLARPTALGLGELAAVAARIAAGIDAAHEADLVHGLLRPADVVFAGDRVVVDGMGLWGALALPAVCAAFRDEGRYLAPEVRAGAPATILSDVYSLAVMLAELAVGADASGLPALGADLRVRLLRAHPRLGYLLDTALAVDPWRRPGSAPALAELLAEVAEAEALNAPADTIVEGIAVPPDEQVDVTDDAATSRWATVSSWPQQSSLARMLLPMLAAGRAPRIDPRTDPRTEDSILAPMPPLAPALFDPPFDSDDGMRLANGTGSQPQFRAITANPLPPFALPASLAQPPSTTPPRIPVLALLLCALLAGTASWIAATLVYKRSGVSRSISREAAAVPVPVPVPVPAPAPVPAPVPVPVRASVPVPVPVPASASAAPVAATACPPPMVPIPGLATCIDRHEAPGEGVPTTDIDLSAARAACATAGKRLCTGREWETACRGVRGASFPYGASYRVGLCNVRRGAVAAILPVGSFAACVSRTGAIDMSGNVAEWVDNGPSHAGGAVRGGSALDGDDGRCSRVSRRTAIDPGAPDVGYRCCK